MKYLTFGLFAVLANVAIFASPVFAELQSLRGSEAIPVPRMPRRC